MGTKEIIKLVSALPKNCDIPVEDILDRVQKSGLLSAADLEPHTQSRPTSYPRWKARVQGVLWELKKKNRVFHDPIRHTYTFV